MDCLKSPAIFPGYSREEPLSLFQHDTSVKSTWKYECMICPREKGGGVAPFISSASSCCSFCFHAFSILWTRLSCNLEQANNRWDWKGATFSFTSCTGRVQIWLFSGTSHIHPQGNILLLPVENLESSLPHVSVNNDVTMERGDSGGSTLLFNKCILQII